MRIGINASFLGKPGTGIGQVSLYFLKNLAETEYGKNNEYYLYLDKDVDISFLPQNFKKQVCLPFWKRDDLPRKWLWEKYTLPRKAGEDKVERFLSLYQSATVLKNIPHVMIVHDLIPRIFPEYRKNWRQKLYWGSVEKSIYEADSLVAVSQSTLNDLVEFGAEKEKITLAYPDVAPIFHALLQDEESERVLEKYGLEKGYIYHGGGLEVRKNAERLLRAYAKLVEKERNSLLDIPLPQLVISGKIFPVTNSLATQVEKLVIELGLDGRVKFLGFVPDADLPALYKNSLFFVYPSLYEGFGLPLLEALLLKVPILTGDNSSLPEVAGDAALYIDAESVESITSGMEKMITDTALRQSLSEKSQRQIEKFNWKNFVEKILAVLMK